MASEFHLDLRDRDLGCFRLHVPGAHNVLNAAAAVAVGLELDVPIETIREALAAFQRRGPPLSGARHRARHHRDRRLRPSSDRDSRHARGGARLPLLARPRAVPAASLHANASPDGRFRARVSSGRYRARAGYLRGLGSAHRGRHRRRRWWTAARLRPSRRALRRHRWTRASKRWSKAAQAGDAIVTLGAGSVSQAGERFWTRLKRSIVWRRRPIEGVGTLPGMDDDSKPGRGRACARAPPPRREIPAWRIAMIVAVIAVVWLISLYALHRSSSS